MLIKLATLFMGSLLACPAAYSAVIPLTTALDDSNLVWTTSSPYPWFGTNDVTFDGTDAAACGNHFVSNSVSWLQTTVVGPGTLSFWWKVNSLTPPDQDQLQFLINGQLQEALQGQVDWCYRNYAIGPGTNLLQWQYVKDNLDNSGTDRGWLDQVHFVSGSPLPLQAALSSCGTTWLSAGNTNPTYWSGQTNITHDGKAAAQSGAVGPLQQSWLQTTVTGVTNVSFWWRVSSESVTNTDKKGNSIITIYDTLGFSVDDVLKTNINVEEQWQPQSWPLSAGPHTLKWTYAKDISGSAGQDCGWVGQVVFSPPLKSRPYTLQPPRPMPDGTVQLTVNGESGCGCGLEVSTNSVTWQTLTNFTTPAATTTVVDPGARGTALKFYRAVSR